MRSACAVRVPARLPVRRSRLPAAARSARARFRTWGPTVVLTDGDAVFQPHKARRAGIHEAVGGDVLVYIHKEHELADVERRYPAEHYVVVDDKLRILTTVKKGLGRARDNRVPAAGAVAPTTPR